MDINILYKHIIFLMDTQNNVTFPISVTNEQFGRDGKNEAR